jgi:hypothetical protein
MTSIRIAGVLLACVAAAGPAGADVTVKQKTGGKGLAGAMISGETTQFLKGTKMRTDQSIGGSQTSTIIDAATAQITVLNHAKREADVYDMTRLGTDLAKIGASDIQASIKPTAQTRQVAGSSCTVYDVKVTVAMTQMGNDTAMVMSGPYCLVKNGPGQADYAAFYRAAAEKGLFFGDPRGVKAQPAQAKAMTEIYRRMADLGVPVASETNISFEGSGPMVAIMSKMGGNSITTETTSVSTGPVPDSTFEMPAGYKINKR